jgi:hypothetical protein
MTISGNEGNQKLVKFTGAKAGEGEGFFIGG